MNEENLEQGIKETKEEVSKLGRRDAIKVGAAVAGGLALGMGAYVKPGIVSVGVQESYAATPGGAGCTPGFWGNNGRQLWDQESDPQWSSPPPLEWPYSGLPRGEQPFATSEPFNTIFPGWSDFTQYDLGDFVPAVPDPPASRVEMAGRACVAAALNAAWFGGQPLFPYTVPQIIAMWNAAVAASGTDPNSPAFGDLATLLDGYNNGTCAT